MNNTIDNKRIPSKEQIWLWQQELNGFGPRFTGNSAHRQSLDFFGQALSQMGLNVHRDKLKFTKWEPKAWGLSVENEHGETVALPVSFYYPYSGKTAADGVTGELIYCGRGAGDFRQATGKIAIVDVDMLKLPSALIFKRRSSLPASERLPFTISNPVISSILKGPDLQKAEEAGVLGVICVWRHLSDENAEGQSLPFTTPLRSCPALWVGGATGDRLKQLALKSARVRLVLDAEITENAESDTLYAILPGTNQQENILINTHTDGPNALEENGGVGLLAMAQYFSGLPLEQRARNIVFVFVTGHFQIPQFGIHGQATSRWLHEHPELWDGQSGHQRAVAGLTLEHLGCREWRDSKEHSSYRSTGHQEMELVYTANEALNRIYLDSLAGRTKVRSITLRPKSSIYFGEGQPLYNAGIPTISLIPAPDYLCAVGPGGHLDKIDPDFMYEQILSFIKITSALSHTPAESIGAPESTAKGIIGLVIKNQNAMH